VQSPLTGKRCVSDWARLFRKHFQGRNPWTSP